ncbi:hypothetical protein INT47_008027 [Mucor saturninus]|uniref:F-box domain-containing protein n=1 Tax=Mucor saturninus TaxID=64648 RepID=A0A8H7V0L1_9FUNG|nr:hypothetical protein INT47_008027 [Mucor saturninus]
MNILSLPTEIWYQVLEFSHNRYQCAFVCKAWTEVSLQQLYKDLRLDGRNICRMKRLLELDADERIPYFKYFDSTTRLTIKREKDREELNSLGYMEYDYGKLEEDQFIFFLDNLPKLQDLHLVNSCYEDYYIAYLRQTDSFKCLNEIQTLPSYSCHDIFSLLYRYHSTITAICMSAYEGHYSQTITWTICESLSQFKHLTHLTLTNERNVHLTPLEVQLACPRLVTFKYSSGPTISDHTIENMLRGVNKNGINSRLKVFQLHVPNLPASYFRYISTYLVPHLDSLDVEVRRYQLLNWIREVGIKDAMVFAKNISRLKERSLEFRYPYKNVTMEDKTAEITNFNKLLNAFKGLRHRLCQGRFKFTGSSHYSMHRSKEDVLEFESTLDPKCYLSPSDSNIVHAYEVALSKYLSDKASFFIEPEMIDCLDIHIDHGNPKLVSVILQYVLVHFPNIQAFKFFMDATSTKTIYIGDDVKELQPRKDRFITSRCGRAGLKVFKSLQFIPSKPLLDLISTHLLNIQVLVYNAKIMYGRWTQKVTEIDLTALKKLQLFQFDDYNIYGYDTDLIFIQLQIDHGDIAYYCRNIETSAVYEATTLQLFQECQDDATLNIRLLNVKYNSGVKFVVSTGNHTMAAEFHNGLLLDFINIDTKFL